LLLDTLQEFSPLIKGRLLDLGCGNKPYFDIYSSLCSESIGCDVPFSLHKDSNVEVLCFAEDIDKHFHKDTFDSIICTEVLEHTLDDRKVMSNINKVIKTGGVLLISVPFTYVLHEEPHDYRRYTYYGLSQLLKDNNFRVVSTHSMGGTLSSGFLIFYYFFMRLFFYAFKKIGITKLRENFVVKTLFSLPELIMYKLYAPFFRKKLKMNSNPGKNEKFSSTGYFFAAIKEN